MTFPVSFEIGLEDKVSGVEEISVEPVSIDEALVAEVEEAASSDSRRRTAEVIDASYPEFFKALRYNLKASSDRRRGFSASCRQT